MDSSALSTCSVGLPTTINISSSSEPQPVLDDYSSPISTFSPSSEIRIPDRQLVEGDFPHTLKRKPACLLAAASAAKQIALLETLPKTVQLEIVTCIMDSGAGMNTISEELARRKGLILDPSPMMARLGDGSIVGSQGKADIIFKFDNLSVLSESCKLSLDAIGFNRSILISRHILTQHKFRFFDSHSSDFGSWIITPSWHWFPLKIEDGATVCEFQMSSDQGNLLLSPITDAPPIRVDLSQALEDLVTPNIKVLEHDQLLHGAAAQIFSEDVEARREYLESEDCSSVYLCLMDPLVDNPACCLTENNKLFKTGNAVTHGLRRFNRQELHEIFGHCSDVVLDNLLDHKLTDTFPKLTKSQRKRSKCRCPSCLRGFHPSRRVPRRSKHNSGDSSYLTGQSWNFDFGRFWQEGDIEGFKTDATFVEHNSRYAYAVLLKDHIHVWEAIEELRRFVREKCEVEVTHLYCDSDPMFRVNGAPSETYTETRQKLSDAGIDCTFSPPNQHALNSWVENFRGRALHLQNSMLQHAYLSSKFRGRCYLHAVYTLNCLPVPGSSHEPLKSGASPWQLLRKAGPDYSVFIAPWGSSCMVKNFGTRSSQLVPCSEYGIIMNVSNDCDAWEIYLPDKQKFVTSTHIVVDSDFSKRLASVERFDLVMSSPGPMSHSAQAYASGLRSLFTNSATITNDLMVQLDPLSRMPVKLVPFEDNDGHKYIMTQKRLDDIESCNALPDSSQLPRAPTPTLDPIPSTVSCDDIASAFVHTNALPSNRNFPLPKSADLSQLEKQMLRNASHHTVLEFNEVNPKQKGSKSAKRYSKYSKCSTLGAFREKFQYSDLENDMARGFVRLYQAPSSQPESHSSYFPVPDANAQIPALSVMQHIDTLPEMWKSVCDVHRISRVIQDLEDVATEYIFNASSAQLERTAVPTHSSSEDSFSVTTDKLELSIKNLCSASVVGDVMAGQPDGPKCSKEDFINRIANISTDNYLKVENLLRAAEQRPSISTRDTDADILRQVYSTVGVGDVFHSDVLNLAGAQSIFPPTFKKAMLLPDASDWVRVTLDEWNRFYHHFNAMEPVSYDQYLDAKKKWGSKVSPPVPMKWVYTIKKHASTGLYNRHKARLVAAQSLVRYSVDDKWSPTLSLDTMRLMLVLACLHNADISALDVSGAYLSGKMDPDDAPIFLRKPDGLSQLNCSPLMPDGSEPYAFIAKSSIYGLQKACKIYLKSYFKFLSRFGLKPSAVDPCLWYKVIDENNWILIGVYSDDNLIVSKGSIRDDFQKFFDSEYSESPDSGEVKPGIIEFLGMMIQKRVLAHNIVEIEISSPKIMTKLRELVGVTPSNFKLVPLVENFQLNDPISEANFLIDENEFNCRSVFGVCLWAAMGWRFDIHYGAARIASSLSKGNTIQNVTACKQLAWYLLESDVQSLKFSNINPTKQFVSFSDASHGNDLKTMRSWFSYLHVWANATFGGRTKLGTTVCRSTKDSEMMAIIACLASTLGYRFLLHEIGFSQQLATSIFIDATAALDQTTSMNIPRDQKFTAMRRAWVFEQFHHSIVKAYHCHTDSMLADANSKRFSASDQAVNARNLQGHGTIKAVSTVDRHRIMN